MTKPVNKKKMTITFVSIVLALSIIITGAAIYDWEQDPLVIKALTRITVETIGGTLYLVALNIALGVGEGYYHVKYNQYWIKNHSKDEIVARYGEFDYYEGSVGYYNKYEISNVSFRAIGIRFNADGCVNYILMDDQYGYPGG